MQYKDFQPTQFDCKGLGLPDRQDWIVVPCITTRDSGPLSESNYETAKQILEEEGAEYEEHSFNHWGPGYFNIIIVHPDYESTVESIENALADYPVLSDEDFSRREYELSEEAWESYGHDDFVMTLVGMFGLSDNAKDLLNNVDKDRTFNYHMDNTDEFPYWEDGSGIVFRFEHLEEITRDQIARTLWNLRK